MEQQSSHKTFFETYQTFFAIIICGILIGGGIVIGKLVQPSSESGSAEAAMTQESVRDDMLKQAKLLKLDKTKFTACIDNGTNKKKIDAAVTLAEKSGVQGTPTFFVIKRKFGADNKIISEKQWSILGARDLADFEASIKSETSPTDQPPITGDKIVLSDSDHYLGPKNAEIVIVEYSDIDCPFCKRAKPTIEKLLADHPEYAFVYRQSPIVGLHPFAAYKAEATECALDLGGEDAFWKLLNTLAK